MVILKCLKLCSNEISTLFWAWTEIRHLPYLEMITVIDNGQAYRHNTSWRSQSVWCPLLEPAQSTSNGRLHGTWTFRTIFGSQNVRANAGRHHHATASQLMWKETRTRRILCIWRTFDLVTEVKAGLLPRHEMQTGARNAPNRISNLIQPCPWISGVTGKVHGTA